MQLEVSIARLGAQGDGVAEGPDGALFVPFALPREHVSVTVEPGSANWSLPLCGRAGLRPK